MRNSFNKPVDGLLCRLTVTTKHVTFYKIRVRGGSSWKLSMPCPPNPIFRAAACCQETFLKPIPVISSPAQLPPGFPQNGPKLLLWFTLTHVGSLFFKVRFSLCCASLKVCSKSPSSWSSGSWCCFWRPVVNWNMDASLFLFPQLPAGPLGARVFSFVRTIPLHLA